MSSKQTDDIFFLGDHAGFEEPILGGTLEEGDAQAVARDVRDRDLDRGLAGGRGPQLRARLGMVEEGGPVLLVVPHPAAVQAGQLVTVGGQVVVVELRG